MEAVKQQTTRLDHRVTSCEESGQEVRIQLGTMMAQDESSSEDEFGKGRMNTTSTENVNASVTSEKVDFMNARIEELEKRMEDDNQLRGKEQQEVERTCQSLQEYVKERIEYRV